jgi:hypothetical protein
LKITHHWSLTRLAGDALKRANELIVEESLGVLVANTGIRSTAGLRSRMAKRSKHGIDEPTSERPFVEEQ